MKKLLFLLLCVPAAAMAQSRQDYIQQAAKFVQLFNQRKTDSICRMFPDEKSTGIKCFWQGSDTDGTYDMYGRITSCVFSELDTISAMRPAVFKVTFTKKGTKAMTLSMNAAHKFTVFRIEDIY